MKLVMSRDRKPSESFRQKTKVSEKKKTENLGSRNDKAETGSAL